MKSRDDLGFRNNAGKTRYDLIPTHLLKGAANVFEKGLKEYPRNNWMKGMYYTTLIASMKRHLAAIEQGIDFDDKTGERHVSHLLCNCLIFEQTMNSFGSELDDRPTELFHDHSVASDPAPLLESNDSDDVAPYLKANYYLKDRL